MLVRIVRLQLKEDTISPFLRLFKETYPLIRHFEGCRFLELYMDEDVPYAYYTMSKWENPEALEKYRNSDLFRNTWKQTKEYFGGAPLAYSLQKSVADATNPF